MSEASYRITASQAKVIIERDFEIRSQMSATLDEEVPRRIKEIAKELSGHDYKMRRSACATPSTSRSRAAAMPTATSAPTT